MRHLGVGESDQLEALLLAHHELLAREHRRLCIRLGVEAVLVETAQPGALDVLRRAGVARCAANHGMNKTRVIAARLQHGILLGTNYATLRASIRTHAADPPCRACPGSVGGGCPGPSR